MNRIPGLESLAENARKVAEAQANPKFISKEERERLAIERRQADEERRREEHLEEQRRREEFLSGRKTSDPSQPLKNVSGLEKEELDLIRQRYIGGQVKKPKKLKRFGDRRNLFDWDADDDTSVALASTFGRAIGGKKELDESEVHWSQKPLQQMKERDWRIMREDFSITTQGGSIPHPIRVWEEAGFYSELKNQVLRLGFSKPTPIQRQAIPIAMQRRDFIGLAETGSGKTLAFLLPMLNYILALPRMNSETALDGPYGLILTPTRELTIQIRNELEKLNEVLKFRSVAIVGGHSVAEQSMNLRRGAEIVIATPGRLRDCLEQHVLVLNQCSSVILDEADRMIDLNFEEDLNFILNAIPYSLHNSANNRQISMFSATMLPAVERIAKLYLQRPAVVTVGETGQAVDRIHQCIEMVSEYEKPQKIITVLSQAEFPVIIFVNQKTTVDVLHSRLASHGYNVIALHGGKNQEQREAAISSIRSGSKDVLIATDVASRGIDIKDVQLVVNFDMAKSIEDYVHRIGRTGRAGKEGRAVTFLTDKDTDVYYDLRVLSQRSKHDPLPQSFLSHEAAQQKPGTVVQKKRRDEKIFAYGV